MWQKSPWIEALSSYWVKLDCAGDPLVLEVPEPWDICQEELQSRSRIQDSDVSKARRAESPMSFNSRLGTTGFGVYPAGLQSLFGPAFPFYVPIPPPREW